MGRRTHSLLLLLCLLLAPATLCLTTAYEVVGTGECADCQKNNFKTSQAFSGLHVTIDCKLHNGEITRVAAGELDEAGNFKLALPKEVVEENSRKLKHDCYAQLHNAGAKPCPGHVDAGKIVFKSEHTFGPAKNLKFSTPLCASKFFWSYFKYPPLPTSFPQFPHSPLNFFGHTFPLPPFHPFFKHPPFFAPPVVKPIPPPVYKPPVYKPPVYKPPAYKPPAVVKPPVYKPPVVGTPPISYFNHPPFPYFKHPLPPPFPFFKHPLPPPFPYFKPPLPPYFSHPKFGFIPPLAPGFPHP